MPRALPKELRDKALAMYCQGIRPSLIAKELGIGQHMLNKWQTRYGWVRCKDKTEDVLKDNHLKSTAHVLAEQQVKLSLSQQLVMDSLASETIKRRNGKHALELQSKLEPLVRNAARVFGWGQDTGQRSLVNIAVLSPGAVSIETSATKQPYSVDVHDR